MDRRTREIERAWHETHEPEVHAELLRALARTGRLTERRILCAAFFGHQGARLASSDKVMRRKIIDGDVVLETEELNSWIDGIFHWPRDVWQRAILGGAKLAQRHILSPKIAEDLIVINKRFEEYLDSPSHESNNEFRKKTRQRMSDWWLYQINESASRRQKGVCLVVSRMLLSGKASQRAQLQNLGSHFKDKIFRKAIGEEVLHYLLGAWK